MDECYVGWMRKTARGSAAQKLASKGQLATVYDKEKMAQITK